MAVLPAPKNALVSVINAILDALIKGLGANMAYAAAVAEFPLLGAPIIGYFFRMFIDHLASSIDNNLKINADIIIIRFQNDARKADYDSAIAKIKLPGATDAEIKAAKDAIDRIVSRTH